MSKNYYKRNYEEALEVITPSFYLEEDSALSGIEIDPIIQVINGHIKACNNISSILDVSTLGTLSGITPYFVKQNKLTDIAAEEFQRNILDSLGVKLGNFGTSGEFKTYLEDTLLPTITLNAPTAFTNEYLIDSLSWMYFLNTSGTNYNPSSDVSLYLATRFYSDEKVTVTDGVEIFTKYLWYHYDSLSSVDPGIIPSNFLSGNGTYTSGTQGLDNLLTLVKIIYNTSFSDLEDTKVKDLFEAYITNGTLSTDTTSKGSFYRFIRSIAVAISDVNDSVNDIEAIYNIEKCPAYQLPLIANLIGWNLFGEDETSWRLQLRNAVGVYKRKGTKAGIQLAIDSVLPSNDFEVSSILTTLYESYVPYIIQYCLATGSDYFKNLNTWTKELADKTGVKYYSNTSLEENLKHVVDFILLGLVTEHNENFIFNNEVFDLDCKYTYRGKTYTIPPFDEEKFYINSKLSNSLLNDLRKKLDCFGVDPDLSTSAIDYITNNTIGSEEQIAINGGFIFFTSSFQNPPNYADLVSNLEVNSLDSIGLWSSKSSHFNIFLDTSAYDFSSLNLEADTGKAVVELARTVEEFSPANAIPNVSLFTDLSSVATYLESLCSILCNNEEEFNSCTYESSGVDMSIASSVFIEEDSSGLILESCAVSVPRNAIRRRGFQNLFKSKEVYDRTGFNQPIVHTLSSIFNDYLYLGYNPSTLEFVNYLTSEFSGVYDQCNTSSCDATYFGVDVSNTYPSRAATYSTSCPKYIDRKTNFEGLLHYLEWKLQTERGKQIIALSPDVYASSIPFINVEENLAETFYPSAGISSKDFEFGVDIHKLYKDYTNNYAKHGLGTYESTYLSGGPDILAHIYGNIFENGELNNIGDASAYVTQNLVSAITLNQNEGSGVFSDGTASTYVASSVSDIYVGNFELHNSSICSTIALIMTSATSNNNEFVYINASSTDAPDILRNGLVTLKAFDGLPRVRVGLLEDNFLLPEHEFKLDIKSSILKSNGAIGGTAYAWIHTGEVGNKVWTYTKNNIWEMVDSDTITKNYVINNSIPVPITNKGVNSNDKCLDNDLSQNVLDIKEGDFTTNSISFNTKNNLISVPEAYYKVSQQVHTLTQKYYVDIFILPSVTDETLVLDSVNLIDSTNLERASIHRNYDITLSTVDVNGIIEEGETSSVEVRYPLEILYLYEIFKYFNSIATDRASRVVSDTSGLLLAEGGSRLNFRTHPDWVAISSNANSQYTEIDMEEKCTA